MTYVSQLIEFVKVSDGVALRMFAASGAALLADWLVPDLLSGLPAFVLPVIRLVAISTGAILVLSSTAQLWKIGTSAAQRRKRAWLRPRQVAAAQKKIRMLKEPAVYVLLAQMPRMQQTFRAPRSYPTIIHLADLGLIEERSSLVFGDGLNEFDIPDHVWQAMLGLDGFYPMHPREIEFPWNSNRPWLLLRIYHIPEAYRSNSADTQIENAP